MFSNLRGNKTTLLWSSRGFVPDSREHVSLESNKGVREMKIPQAHSFSGTGTGRGQASGTSPEQMPDAAVPKERLDIKAKAEDSPKPCSFTADWNSLVLKSRYDAELASRYAMISKLQVKLQLSEEAAYKQGIELQDKLRAANAERSEQGLRGSV